MRSAQSDLKVLLSTPKILSLYFPDRNSSELTLHPRLLCIVLLFLASAGLIGLGLLSPVRAVSASPVLVENFVNNSFNQSLWQTEVVGNGPTVTVANGQFVVTIPSSSSDNPTYGSFGGAFVSKCLLQGNFDMQVGVQLLTWPHYSGVRTGLGSIELLSGQGSKQSNQYAVERDSFSSFDDFPYNDSYLTQFQDGVLGFTPATGFSAMLRITRVGGTASGFYLNNGTWTLIHSGPMASGEVGFSFGAWSSNNVFSQQLVQVAFQNFTLDAGQLVCPTVTANPPTGPIGTLVTVSGTNYLTPTNNQTTTVEVTFEDMFLGTAINNGGSFTFTFDVPLSQPGPHQIIATDPSTGANASTTFQVTTVPSAPTVGLTVGTLYFPGDSVVASVLVTSNGIPLSSFGLQLYLNLTTPDGSTLVLAVTSIGNGLFRASYLLPKGATIGTYTLLAVAKAPSLGSGSAISSFEVKLPWLSSLGTSVIEGGVASLGVTGVALVSWRKGYFRRSPKSQL
jgi:hypothetical protein